MKKVLLSLMFLPFFLLIASPAFAEGTFTASNVCWNPSTNYLQFDASNYSPALTGSEENINDVAFAQDGNSVTLAYWSANNGIELNLPNETTHFNELLYPNAHFGFPELPTDATPFYIYVAYRSSGNWWSQQLTYAEVTSCNSPTPIPTLTPIPPSAPTNKTECKKDGWMSFVSLFFKNQGSCIKSVNK